MADNQQRKKQKGARSPPAGSASKASDTSAPNAPMPPKGLLTRIVCSPYIMASLFLLSWVFQRYIFGSPFHRLPPELEPFHGPKVKSLDQFQGEHNDRLLWGTYRSGYYFGSRTRTPKSLLTGLMWADPNRPHAMNNIRHEASASHGLDRYGWLVHDGETYGRQELKDEQFLITTKWLKNRCDGCGPGGDWSLRIEADYNASHVPRRAVVVLDGEEYPEEYDEAAGPRKTDEITFFIYVATEDMGAIQMQGPSPHFGGKTAPLGNWEYHLAAIPRLPGQEQVEVHSMGLATPHFHNLTDQVVQGLMYSLYAQADAVVAAGGDMMMVDPLEMKLSLPNLAMDYSNFAVLQLTATLPLSLDLVFVSGLEKIPRDKYSSTMNTRIKSMSGDSLTAKMDAAEAAFHRKFDQTFSVMQPPKVPYGSAEMAKAALSNLIGGIGYWYGHTLAELSPGKIIPMWNTPLYSAVPSRSNFPRGFLWDEGFHQLLVQRWHPAISRDILAHWLDTMTMSGWIPREQILGEEARSRVPAEYLTKSPSNANPPSLFLPILNMVESNTTEDREFLKAAWPRIKTWYEWLKSSQKGSVDGSFRWRGRDGSTTRELNPKTLASGLDDYPRASHPTDDEMHLDLKCWVAVVSRVAVAAAKAAGVTGEELQHLISESKGLYDFDTLYKLHWDDTRQHFADWGLHTEKTRLNTLDREAYGWYRIVEEEPKLQFVPHYGYVSLFPLLMDLIPEDNVDLLRQQLELLKQANGLWTPYGLRSLSTSSSMYKQFNTPHDPPYWRNTVWGNINYLAVKALEKLAKHPSDAELAKTAEGMVEELRRGILNNLVAQYNTTGYIWEQYDDGTGQGHGVHPFTGWTALLAVMSAEGQARR